jgi:uncharacterized repeat protein (TIGR01451 family)
MGAMHRPNRVKIGLTINWLFALVAIALLTTPTPLARGDSPSSEDKLASPTAADPLVQQMIDAVSTTRLVHHLCKLQDDDAGAYCNAQGSRLSTSTAAINQARDYVSGYFHDLGLTWHYHDFTLYGYQRQNVIAELPGVDPTSNAVYIVSAHYDSTSSSPYAPGADDNGSGTASVLESAEVLKDYRFRHTIRFVLFAGEEQGLYGSAAYAAYVASQGTNLQGLINLDMVAYDSDANPVVELHTRNPQDSGDNALADRFTNAVSNYSLSLNPQLISPGISASDHSNFWRNYPAMLVIIDYSGNPNDWDSSLHTTNDQLCITPNPGNESNPCQTYRLNLGYHRRVTQATLATLAQLAEPVTAPDLTVTQAGTAIGRPGAVLTYTVTYANAGYLAASGVVITDSLPAELSYFSDSSGLPTLPLLDGARWTAGDLAPGIEETFVVTITVSAELVSQTAVTSTVSIAGINGDVDSASNQARFSTWLCQAPAEDVTGDGVVNGTDLALAATAWRIQPANPTFDRDGDSDVDSRDLQLLNRRWGAVCAE